MGFVQSAREEGARLVTGGRKPDDPALAGAKAAKPPAQKAPRSTVAAPPATPDGPPLPATGGDAVSGAAVVALLAALVLWRLRRA